VEAASEGAARSRAGGRRESMAGAVMLLWCGVGGLAVARRAPLQASSICSGGVRLSVTPSRAKAGLGPGKMKMGW
jgi:hypothetical protein